MTSSVEKILPSLSKVAKTATIEIPFPEKNTADIYVGQSVQVSIVLGEKKAVPVVPLEALKEEQGKNYIFVIKDNKALRREVKTGLSNGHQVEIIEGLTKGEEIIITRSMEVRDGSKVIVYNRGV
jgi:HlyD family secretion protein